MDQEFDDQPSILELIDTLIRNYQKLGEHPLVDKGHDLIIKQGLSFLISFKREYQDPIKSENVYIIEPDFGS